MNSNNCLASAIRWKDQEVENEIKNSDILVHSSVDSTNDFGRSFSGSLTNADREK